MNTPIFQFAMDASEAAQAVRGLRGQLPALKFDPILDGEIWATDAGKAYQSMYRLPTQAQVTRGLGALDLAGYRIAVQYFLPKAPRATLVIVHGLYDHIGIYHEAVSWALEHDFAVLGFDLPGHGLSSGREVSIDSFDEYGDVLAGVLESLLMHTDLFPAPLHALGQSTGGAIWLNLLLRHPVLAPHIDKRAFLAPLVLPRGWALGRWTYHAVRRLRRSIPRGPSMSSHNREMLDFINVTDPLQSRVLTMAWLGAMNQWAKTFARATPIKGEALVLQGTRDSTLNWRYNVKIIKEKLPDAQIEYIDGADHQLLNESPEYLDCVKRNLTHYFFKTKE